MAPDRRSRILPCSRGSSGGQPAPVGPDVGEGLQHADGALEQRAVPAEPPLCLQGAHPFQGEFQRLVLVEPGRGAGDGVLAVGAAQQVQGAGAVAAPPAVGRGRVQHPGQNGPFVQPARVCGRPFRGRLGLLEEVVAALYLPQPQGAVRVLGPQFGVRARPLACGGAAQQLHRVDDVLDHALAVEALDQRSGPADRLVRRPFHRLARSGPASGALELLGQRHEPPQHAGGDLREGLGHGGLLAVATVVPVVPVVPVVGAVSAVGVVPVVAVVAVVAVVRALGAGCVRAARAAVAELGQGEGGEVGAALAEALLDVLRAVLEHQHGLVAA